MTFEGDPGAQRASLSPGKQRTPTHRDGRLHRWRIRGNSDREGDCSY